MEIKPIKTEKDYKKSLERLDLIFDANSKKGDEAEILSMLIDNYENKYFPIEASKENEKKIFIILKNFFNKRIKF